MTREVSIEFSLKRQRRKLFEWLRRYGKCLKVERCGISYAVKWK